jgi:hypothetical protein
LGSELPLPERTLKQFADLVNRTQPKLVSEHLCFNRAQLGETIYHSGDLLPIAYTESSLNQLVSNIQQVQDAIKRPLLIENLSAYLSPSDIDKYSIDSMHEFEFLTRMCEQAGCGLLLDLNNLIVNALNRKEPDVIDSSVALVDDHGQAVSQQCWQLYKEVIAYAGNVATLVEWDTNLPAWQTLVQQCNTARSLALANAG